MRYASPLRYPGGKAGLTGFLSDIIEINCLCGCRYYEPFPDMIASAKRGIIDLWGEKASWPATTMASSDIKWLDDLCTQVHLIKDSVYTLQLGTEVFSGPSLDLTTNPETQRKLFL